MNIYDKQSDIETETYSQSLYEERQIEIADKIENYDDAIGYLEEIKANYINLKDIMNKLHQYSKVTEYQQIINDIDTEIMEQKILRDEV